MNKLDPTDPPPEVTPRMWAVLRPLDRPGWQPALIVLCGFVAIMVSAFLGVHLSDERDLFYTNKPEAIGIQGDMIILAILSAGLCYLGAVLIYQHRLYEQVLNDLQPVIDLPAEKYAAMVASRAAPSQMSLTVGALCGVGLSFIWLLMDPRVYQGDYNPWDFANLGILSPWHRVVGGLMGGAIGAFMNSTIHSAMFLNRLGARLKPLDLFDLAPLQPFARQGVANVLWLTGYTTIFATTYFLSPEVFLLMIVSFVILNAVLSLSGLMVPVIGVARRIHQRKDIELNSIQQELKLLGPAHNLAQSGHLTRSAQLLNYRSFVLSVSVFPYNFATFVRVGLFLMIPLWSWVASSVVDRGVGSLFGWE